MPKTELNNINWSKNESLYKAEIIPKNKPKMSAIEIEVIARINVFLNVSIKILKTDTLVLTKDSLK